MQTLAYIPDGFSFQYILSQVIDGTAAGQKTARQHVYGAMMLRSGADSMVAVSASPSCFSPAPLKIMDSLLSQVGADSLKNVAL